MNQVMGDGMMARCGAPIAHEEHAVRACYDALALQAAGRRYSAEVRRERFGQRFLPAVLSRAYLAECHAELGMFPEGRAFGDEGLRITEAVNHPASLMAASWGTGLLSLRQGDLPGALLRLERAVDICQDADIPAYFPLMAVALGAAYTLGRRVADAVPLLRRATEQARRRWKEWTSRLSVASP